MVTSLGVFTTLRLEKNEMNFLKQKNKKVSVFLFQLVATPGLSLEDSRRKKHMYCVENLDIEGREISQQPNSIRKRIFGE